MTDRTAEKVCLERVSEPPGFWHDHQCGRKAKWWVKVNKGSTSNPEWRRRPVCGVHVKWHQKYGEVLGPLAHNDEPSDEADSAANGRRSDDA